MIFPYRPPVGSVWTLRRPDSDAVSCNSQSDRLMSLIATMASLHSIALKKVADNTFRLHTQYNGL